MLSKVPSNGWDKVNLQLKSSDGTILNGVLSEEMLLCALLEIISTRKISEEMPLDDDDTQVDPNMIIRGGHLLMEIEGIQDQQTQEQIALMESILNGPRGILMADDYSSKHGVETIFMAVHNGGGPVLIRKDPSEGEMAFRVLTDGGNGIKVTNDYREAFPEENFLEEMSSRGIAARQSTEEKPRKESKLDSDDDIPF
jgi:hypothetical protein